MASYTQTAPDRHVLAWEEEVRRRLGRLSGAVDDVFIEDRRLVLAIGDRGSFSIVATVLGRERAVARSVTLSSVDGIVASRRIATSRRSRALVEWLDQVGGVDRRPSGSGARERPFRVSGWLLVRLAGLSRAVRHAVVGRVGPGGGDPDGPSDDAVFAALVDECYGFVRSGAVLPPDIQTIAEWRGGMLLLLRMVAGARRRPDGLVEVDVSRKSFSRGHGLSRAHVTGVIARAERLGLLRRGPGTAILLGGGFDAASLRFFHRVWNRVEAIVVRGPRDDG